VRDKHVDFLIVERGQYKPVLGIELDEASHENDQQRYRDAVKDTLFASARLPLTSSGRPAAPPTRRAARASAQPHLGGDALKLSADKPLHRRTQGRFFVARKTSAEAEECQASSPDVQIYGMAHRAGFNT